MNIIARLEYELAYYDSAVHRFNHYTTKVPTDETLTVVQNKLATDPSLEEHTCILVDNLMETLTLCVKTTYFGMESDIYQQKEALSMGSPLFLILANVYMEYFKEMASSYSS